jgi:GAF domain-containing protein
MNFEPLNRLADLLANPQGVSDIYAAAIDAVIRTLGGDRAAILVLDDTGVMRFRAWQRLSEEYRVSVSDYSPWEPGATEPPSIRVPDTLADASQGSLRAAARAEGIRALAFIPLSCLRRACSAGWSCTTTRRTTSPQKRRRSRRSSPTTWPRASIASARRRK